MLCSLIIACSKDDDNNHEPSTEVFINYSIAGNSKNGTFNINGDSNNSEQNAYGSVIPNEDGNAVTLSFLDYNQLISVGIVVPAAVGTYEITDTNPYGYNIGFGFDDISLEASSVSIDITEIEFDGLSLQHIKGSFTGVAVVIGEAMEQQHLVDGNFEYNLPY